MRHSGLRRYNASLKVASERPRSAVVEVHVSCSGGHTGRKMSRFDCEFIRFSRSEIIRLASLARVPDVPLVGLEGFVTFLRICEINYGELFLARERSPANDAGFPNRRRRRRPIDDAQQTFAREP